MKIIIIFFFTLFTPLINLTGAQPTSTWTPPSQPYATFTPSLAIIVAVLVAALFFMGFFSIYIRHCGETAAGGTGLRRAISLRNRRLAAARGLDADVIETFPTFTYSEVKDHKIGKGALECAVCLNEFEDDETLRLIPKCDHVFHPECIDAWLESHVTCPVCRANLAPGADVEPVQPPVENGADSVHSVNEGVERSDSRSEQVVIEVEGVNETDQVPKMNRIGSLDCTSQPRSWSMRMFGVGKFRSHSTGHSLVQPGENMDRFTLRLPTQLRKDMMNRASLKRVGTIGRYASTLPREQSSKRGFRGEGSNRSYKKVDPQAKSDRWVFFTRGLSMKSLRVGSEADHGSLPETSSSAGTKNSVRKPSFSCLEPKADDEAGLFSEDQLANKSSV